MNISSGRVDFSEEVAVPSTRTPTHERDRTNSRLLIALPERNETKPAVTYAAPTPMVEYIAPAVNRVRVKSDANSILSLSIFRNMLLGSKEHFELV